jgi:predicted RNA binding protein YcfA (HicA-like mRNA interferase family)
MNRTEKLLIKILRGTSDANVEFDEMRSLLSRLGFEERIRGSHHIFTRDGIEEILNIQARGSKAKPYQVKQVRNVILRHALAGEGDE